MTPHDDAADLVTTFRSGHHRRCFRALAKSLPVYEHGTFGHFIIMLKEVREGLMLRTLRKRKPTERRMVHGGPKHGYRSDTAKIRS